MSCAKRRYRTWVDAAIALMSCQTSDSPRRHEQRAYWCDRCGGGYHLTSQQRQETR